MTVIGIASQIPEIFLNRIAFLFSVQSAERLIDVSQVVGVEIEFDASRDIVLKRVLTRGGENLVECNGLFEREL